MKENRWDSALCLLIPTWSGPFMAVFAPSCDVVRDERSGVGWRGRTHRPMVPDFLHTEHLREDIPRCAHSGWAHPDPVDMGYREAADQIFAESCLSAAWTLCHPSALHTRMHTCAHTALSRNLQAFIQLSVQTHLCPIQLNKHVPFVLKRHPEKCKHT